MDADNKSSNGAVDIMAAVLSNMNKELPITTSLSLGMAKDGVAAQKRAPLDHLNDADLLDDLERSDNGDGSEKKDESTEKKSSSSATNTSNETAGSSCRDDSDVDIFVSASNKLVGYRYSVDELLDISAADCCKSSPDFVTNELFKVSEEKLCCALVFNCH